jgi:hypothetical protein
MKDTLESARNIHQILIVISVIIMSFSVSLMLKETVFETAKKRIESSVVSLRADIVSDRIRVSLDSIPRIISEQEVSKFKSDSFSASLGRYRNTYYGYPLESAKSDLKYLNERIADTKAEVDSAGDDIEYFKEMNKELTDAYIERGEVKQKIARLEREKVGALAKIKDDAQPLPTMDKGKYDDKKLPVADLIKYWSQNMGSELFSEEIAESERFRLLLSANAKMPIADFIKLLETEMENQKNNPDSEIDLIGVKVAAKTIVILAPFIIIAIMIYLLMLINHLNDTATLRQHTDEIADFPWMGVFRGPITAIGFSISTIVIPFLGAFSPHYASRGIDGLGTITFGLSLAGFLIFSLLIQFSISKLHEKVKLISNIQI